MQNECKMLMVSSNGNKNEFRSIHENRKNWGNYKQDIHTVIHTICLECTHFYHEKKQSLHYVEFTHRKKRTCSDMKNLMIELTCELT